MNRIVKLARLRFGLPYARSADGARDHSRWIDAVVDYRRAFDWMPWREDLKIQIGNCLKEFGDYEGAVRAYGSITAGLHLPEARKQMADAIDRAGASLLPFAVTEAASGGTVASSPAPLLTERLLPNRMRPEGDHSFHWLGTLRLPDRGRALARRISYASIRLAQVGTFLLDRDGVQEPLLAGIVAIRGRVSALAQLTDVEVWLGEGPQARRVETALLYRMKAGLGPLKSYAFNVWIDSALLPTGRHWLSVRTNGKVPPAGLFVTVGHVSAGMLSSSDSFVPSLGSKAICVDEAVLAAPARIRSSSRGLFATPIQSILVVRADQLGDVSSSLPALRRLRELYPDASLTALVQPGVRAVVEVSGLVDEVLTLSLSYAAETERRHLSRDEESRVTALLASRHFDLAIDLSPGDESRPLLLLSGATYLVGFNAERHSFLDFGVSIQSRDKSNRLNIVSHAAIVMALIETLGIAAKGDWAPVERANGRTGMIETLGLESREYIVIHAGARHAINCWPKEYFERLANRLLATTPYDVVLFGVGDDPWTAEIDRLHRFDLVAPELFDAILSDARVVVGNDSGPKHLAAARGVPTVSIHVGRLNWNEWGQIGHGAIISKRVPCAGCGLNDIELCGRDAACLSSISVEEVLAAITPYLAVPQRDAD
jgi:ADP-heptose:LPS heptosyltransferase